MMRIDMILCLLTFLAAAPLAVADDATTKPAEGEAKYAEEHWPIGFKLPWEMIKAWKRADKTHKSAKADILVWVPPKAKRVRAVYLIPNNTDSKNAAQHDAVRKVCEKHEIGIVYLRYVAGNVVERSDPPTIADETFAAILDMIARRTGIAEFRHAPWITFGKSSRGRFPFRTTWWFPDRVIASIGYHSETPTWPMEAWSKVEDQSVLHVAINGEQEWSGTWYRHVRPSMLNYQLNTNWLTHQVVLPGVGHGNYVDAHGSQGWGKPVPEGTMSVLRVWDYIALYIDKAMQLRVPEGAYATDGPIKLKQVDRDSGYLIHPRAPEALLGIKWMAFRFKDGAYQTIPWPDEKHPVHDTEQGSVNKKLLIRKATDVPEDERRKYFWVADRQQAEAWLALHNVKGSAAGVMPK